MLVIDFRITNAVLLLTDWPGVDSRSLLLSQAGGELEQRIRRICGGDISELVCRFAGARIVPRALHHNLQVGRVPRDRRDGNGLCISDLTRRNGSNGLSALCAQARARDWLRT